MGGFVRDSRWETEGGLQLRGESPEEVAHDAGRIIRRLRQDARNRLISVGLVTLVVAGGGGYLVGNWRGSTTTRESVTRRADSRAALLVEAIAAKDGGIRACRQVLHRATRVIRARSLYIENLYDDTLRDIGTAYELGVAGNLEELQGGLGRSIAESSQLEDFAASQIAANGWTGWAHEQTLAACRESELGLPAGRL